MGTSGYHFRWPHLGFARGWGRRLEGRTANELRDVEIPLNGVYP